MDKQTINRILLLIFISTFCNAQGIFIPRPNTSNKKEKSSQSKRSETKYEVNLNNYLKISRLSNQRLFLYGDWNKTHNLLSFEVVVKKDQKIKSYEISTSTPKKINSKYRVFTEYIEEDRVGKQTISGEIINDSGKLYFTGTLTFSHNDLVITHKFTKKELRISREKVKVKVVNTASEEYAIRMSFCREEDILARNIYCCFAGAKNQVFEKSEDSHFGLNGCLHTLNNDSIRNDIEQNKNFFKDHVKKKQFLKGK